MSFYGFRRWRVSDEGKLLPLTIRTAPAWVPGKQPAARCMCHGRYFLLDIGSLAGQLPHPHPTWQTTCGYHMYCDPILPCFCQQTDQVLHGAVGVVRAWGKYAQHTDGWRTQYAEVVALVDLSGKLSPDYPATRYPDLPTMYAEWAPDRTVWAMDDLDWCQQFGRSVGLYWGSQAFQWCPVTWAVVQGGPIPRQGTYDQMVRQGVQLRQDMNIAFVRALEARKFQRDAACGS
jgi:hypothetical protein